MTSEPPLRLAVATIERHPTHPRAWSGTPAHIVEALRDTSGVDLHLVGPVGRVAVLAGRAVSGVTRRAPWGRLSWEVEPLMVRHLSRSLRRSLRRVAPVDAVLVLGWAPLRIAGLPPVVFWGDASMGQRLDDAPYWSDLHPRSRRLVEPMERQVLRTLHATVMPSAWAAEDVVARYGLRPDSVHVVPFGSNLPLPARVARSGVPSPVRLLTIGVDWHRKGVDRTVTAADELVARGVPVHLDVVGVVPPSAAWHRPHVTYHGFVDASTAAGRERLEGLYRQATLFLLPSRHDPFPMVLAEAASYGLPAVVTRVGGVPDRVVDGVTGLVLDPAAGAASLADAVERIARAPEEYVRMAEAARGRAEDHFRWEASVARVVEIIRAVTQEGPHDDLLPPSLDDG